MDESVVSLADGVFSTGELRVFPEKKTLGGMQKECLLAELVSDTRSVSADMPMDDVVHWDKQGLSDLPVTDNGRLVGLIGQQALLKYALQGAVADKGLACDYMEPVSRSFEPSKKVRTLVLELKNRVLSLTGQVLFVADKSGEYVGVVSLSDVLVAASALVQDQGRYINPLTGLPGRVCVDETVVELTRSNSMFVVAHVGINDLHAYNERYSYAKGDEVISQVARVLESVRDSELDTLAHLHGGRFTLVFRSSDWFDRCDSAITAIDELAHRYYSKTDRWEGGVTTTTRLGERQFSPFFSLSIGAVPVYPGKFDSSHEIFSAASEVEKRASQTYGGAIYVDQRNYRSDMGELTVRLS